MNVPSFGIAYAFAGTACALWSFGKVDAKLLYRLSALILVIAAVNAYIEEWINLKRFDFLGLTLLLTVGLLWAHTMLILGLMERIGIKKRSTAFVSSFLPIVYALSAGLALALPDIKTDENPPLTVYIFLILIFAIHVPAFAFGKSHATKEQRPSILPHADRLEYFSGLRIPFLALGLPLLVTFAIQASTRDDWRLFGIDAVMTIATTSLFAIAGLKADSPMRAMNAADDK